MGQRSRKRGRRSRPGAVATAEHPRATPTAKPLSRSQRRDAEVRASLKPLAPGERPWAVRIGAALALMVGAGNLIDAALGGQVTVNRSHAGLGGVILFSVMMIICAVGMWRMRYWAVLGFQALLAIVILVFSLYLIRASNVLGFLFAGLIVIGGGFLFYKLVRALSRIQMPRYPGP